MSNHVLARPYARAVFQLASEQSALVEWSEVLELLAVIGADERVARFLRAPRVPAAKRVEFIRAVAGEHLGDSADNLVRLLADNGRLPLLAEIAEQYEGLRAAHEGRIEAHVASAAELTKQQRDDIVKALKKRLQREVTLHTEVDESLLGGAIIRAGDMVIDGSLRGRLQRLGSRLAR